MYGGEGRGEGAESEISLLCWKRQIELSLRKRDFPDGSDSKVSAYNVGDPGSIPGSGRASGEGNGSPLQCSCLENPMGGVW